MLEIYSTGGGDFLHQTLNAVAAFTATENFNALINIGLLCGVIFTVWQIVLGGNIMESLKTYVIIGVLAALSLTPREDVIIFDKTKGVLWSKTVDNVPLSVAYIGSFTSTVSDVLTTNMEAISSPPDSLGYQRNGMLFGATIMAKTSRWRAVTASIHENLVNFFDQCMIDAVELRYFTPDELTRSGDLAATIAANMPNSLSYYDVATSSTRLCSEGWDDLESSIEDEVEVVIAAQAASTFKAGSDEDAVTAVSRLKDTIGDFASFAGFASTSAEDHIRQSVLIAAMDDAAFRGIASTGNAAALQHLQSARAEVQTRSSYEAVGSNALSWVPYLKIVFENLYYGAFPIALLMMMTPLALSVAKGYFGGFVWLASWEPLSAILHSIMLNGSVSRFQTVTSESLTGKYTDSVMSWANHFAVYSIGQDVAVMAGYLMMSIPFVATALFFGTNRMVGLATSMLAVSQSAASETGRETATGNYSYGNTSVGNMSANNLSRDNYARNNRSFNNTTANQHRTSSLKDHGRTTTFGHDGTQITRNRDGSYGFDGASRRVNTALGMSLGTSVASSIRSQSSQMMERGDSARKTFENSLSDLESRTSSFSQSISDGTLYTSGQGASMSSEDRQTLSDSNSIVEQFAKTNNISQKTAVAIGTHASVGANWGVLSAGAKASLERQGISQDTYTDLLQAAKTSSLDAAVSDLDRVYNDVSKSDTNGRSTNTDKSNRLSIDQVSRQAESSENYRRASESYSEVADKLESDARNGNVDLGGAFAQWLLSEKGLNTTQTAEILNGRNFNAEHRGLMQEFGQQFVKDIVEPEISDKFGTDIPAPRQTPHSEPIGDVYDYNSGHQSSEFARQSLDAETRILRQSSSHEGVGGQSVSQDQAAVEKTVRDGQQSSLANKADRGLDSISDFAKGALGMSDGRVTYLSEPGEHSSVVPINNTERDQVIRTVAGEAANQGERGHRGVAFTIKNRVEDSRYPDSAGAVVTQPRQFSVWNNDGSGNAVGQNLSPNSPLYQQIGNVVDEVFAGQVADPTGGSTHYYSPKGMDALVDSGYQNNREPGWLDQTEAESNGSVSIGDHRFSGKKK